VQHRRLQHTTERRCLLWLTLVTTFGFFHRLLEVLIQLLTQPGQVRTHGAENLFAIGVMRQGKQQMFKREVGVTTGDGLAVGDGEHNLDGG